jgi:exopolysaccharide biosynthesis predicted pyruvyltransferase EpsI
LVIDPTLLLEKKEYERLIDFSTCKLKPSKQLFAYVLSQSERRPADIEAIAKLHGMDYEASYLNGKQDLIPVEQWIKNIRDAELVVTDSFHGVVFSIMMNTPFIVLVNEVGGISRLENLLGELNLEDRLVKDEDLEKYTTTTMKPIDWRRVNQIVKKKRKQSGNWLLKAVQ